MSGTDVKEQLREFIAKEFSRAGGKVSADDPLLERGIIDSVGILRLVGFIESKFGVRVKDRELVPEIFHSVKTLAAFIEKKRGK
jgi:acyl carrier protein